MAEIDEGIVEALYASYVTAVPGLDPKVITCAACNVKDRARFVHTDNGTCAGICARAHIRAVHYDSAVLTLDALARMLPDAAEQEEIATLVAARDLAQDRADRFARGLAALSRGLAGLGQHHKHTLSIQAHAHVLALVSQVNSLISADRLSMPRGVKLRLIRKEAADVG